MIYGAARVSTGKQSIDRQIRNILAEYPTAKIIKEVYTGTKLEGRKEFEKLLKIIQKDDTIVFDSCSRMSRNVEEAMNLYEELFEKGVNLVFLKEHHIDTDTYKKAIETQINLTAETGSEATDELINTIIQALNKYSLSLAKDQIKMVFAQAEKEVLDLRQRTREGIQTARLAGKQIGRPKGQDHTTQKSIKSKEIIVKHSSSFNGSLNDEEVMKLCGISRNSYYKYKREIKAANQ